MNSALKPVLPQPGVPQPGGQASPAKANVANANHAVGHPQGAQNSLHHAGNNLVGQNLTHHAPAPPAPAPLHGPPPMAPVSANMAQMAQNMSHHGNLSHVTQNSVGPSNLVASPSKAGTPTTPLSLVQDKALALTRTPEKNEPDSTGHANGTVDSSKSGANAPSTLKPQNPESNNDKQDIAKTSPSTPKPPEKPAEPSTPQKPDSANPASSAEGPVQPKVATANEPPEKSPSKPNELKPAQPADVAPSQSDSKPVPESANDSQLQEKAPTPVKEDSPPVAESAKTENVVEVEQKKEEPKVDKVEEKPQPQEQQNEEEKKEEVKQPEKTPPPEAPKKEEAAEPAPVEKAEKPEKVEKEKVEAKVEEKKPEPKAAKPEAKPKPTLKLATVTTPMRKRRQASPSKSSDGPTLVKKQPDGDSTPDSRATKRNRTQVQLYQSPTPELAMATKLSASAGRSTPTKPNDDKLIVFYKNEYLAVRNAEGGFYVCQAMQNVYRTTRKIKIRWLSQDKASDPSGETYKPDFYDTTDMECVLTTLSLSRGSGGTQLLRAAEAARARSILQRALQAEAGGERAPASLTEEHPDGLDLSLYTDESQLEKKSRKRNSSKSSPRAKHDTSKDSEESATPVKRARTTPKRSPKSARKAKPQSPKANNKRKPAGTPPTVATTSKTATAVVEKSESNKSKAKSTPKRTPAKQKESPVLPTPTRGRRAAKELKPSPIVPTPSTSTGKTTRTPRKPPSKK